MVDTELEKVVPCSRRPEPITAEECLNCFVEGNAFNVASHVGLNCVEGERFRRVFNRGYRATNLTYAQAKKALQALKSMPSLRVRVMDGVMDGGKRRKRKNRNSGGGKPAEPAKR